MQLVAHSSPRIAIQLPFPSSNASEVERPRNASIAAGSKLGPMFELKAFPAQGSKQALLSVRQVAQLLGVSTAIVYRLCEHGDLAHVRISNVIRIASGDLGTWEAWAPGR
jgi:excisionase family DNA binding protein